MNYLEVRKILLSIYFVFSIISTGFVGLLVFDGINDGGGVEAASTLYVGTGQTYTKIQDAIDAASSGDTIRVYGGTYYENVDIYKTLSLIGNGSSNTIIDGGGIDIVVNFGANWINITNFSIRNSHWSDMGIRCDGWENCSIIGNEFVTNDGDGIYLDNSKNIRVINNKIDTNFGEGIYMYGSSKNQFINNTCRFNNYGILIRHSTNNIFVNNNCSNNSFAGIFFRLSTNNLLENNTCSNNTNSGIYIWDSSNFHLINNTCNLDRGRHGIELRNCSNSIIKNNLCMTNIIGISANGFNNSFINNTCNYNDYYGIGIAASNCTIVNNTCSYNNDNGIHLVQSSNNTIINNECSFNEEGIYLKDYSKNNVVFMCQIYNNDQGIFLKSSSNASIFNNHIFNNNDYGINNLDSLILVNATNNWWGNKTGPYDPSDDRATGGWYNPNGTGDNVSDYVEYYPWLDLNLPPEIMTNDIFQVNEDTLYLVEYRAIDPNFNDIISWDCYTNASWLFWNASNVTLHGLPNNSHVRSYWVCINITDNNGRYDEHNFTLTVLNTPTKILTIDNETTEEDQLYYIDYDSSDDDQGVITWHLSTNTTSWLQINSTNGILYGIPSNADVGSCWVNVSVDDGNEGWDSSNFTLYITNKNDQPEILMNHTPTATEDEEYRVIYEAEDIDIIHGDKITWDMNSNTSFLSMDSVSGELSGIPTNDDVGIYWVNISISDIAQASNSQNFTLTVINVNDAPVITSEPIVEATAMELYEYQLNVTDVDKGDTLTYSLDTSPDNMVINNTSGMITWIPEAEQKGDNLVIVQVSDNNESDTQEFNIKVITPANYAPWATLISPANGSMVNVTNPTLTWSSEDPDSEVIEYYVYLHADRSKVRTFDPISQLDNDQTEESYQTTGLTRGSLYYWTVIPDDGEANGKCSSGIWWFRVSETATINIAPVITSDPIKNAVVGEQYRYEVLAEDDNKDDVLEFFLIVHPGNMIIDADSGVILWMPNQDQLGKHTVTVKVSDGRLFRLQTFEITVTKEPLINYKIEVTEIPEQTIMVGEKYSYQVIASDADNGDVLNYKLENTPVGMMINTTGMITWAPNKDQVGKHTISLNVSDGKDNVLIKFTVNVIKKDTTSGDSGSAIQASIIIVIIVIIVLLALAMFMMKRKKSKKDESAPLGVLEQEVPPPEMIATPSATQTTTSKLDVPQTIQTDIPTDESTVPAPSLQEASQLGATPVQEVTSNQLPQTPQIQPTPQMTAATSNEPTPAPIPQIEMPPEDITPVVEEPVLETEPQPPNTELPQNAYVQQEPQPMPQDQETQSSILPTIEPIQPTQTEQTPTEGSQSKEQNLCTTCNQPLTFYSQNNKFYCPHCQKYV